MTNTRITINASQIHRALIAQVRQQNASMTNEEFSVFIRSYTLDMYRQALCLDNVDDSEIPRVRDMSEEQQMIVMNHELSLIIGNA